MHLARRPGVVFPRDQLLADVWGYQDDVGPRTVDSHIAGLRRKLGPGWVRTARGVGYAFDPAERRVRLLDRIPSIKLRLGLVIVVGIGASGIAALVRRGHRAAGDPFGARRHGRGARARAGDRARPDLRRCARWRRPAARWRAASHGVRVAGDDRADEVGELARAFNAMSAELAETDRQRRDIVANVAHELRTPIGALQAKLENVADGVDRAGGLRDDAAQVAAARAARGAAARPVAAREPVDSVRAAPVRRRRGARAGGARGAAARPRPASS